MKLPVHTSSTVVRTSLAFLHLSIAAIGFLRHNMIEIVPSYHSFGQLGDTYAWAWSATILGLALLLLKRGTLIMIVTQFFSSAFFVLLSLLVSAKYGLFWGSLAWGYPSALSLVLMSYNLDEYFRHIHWITRARARIQELRNAT